MEIRWNVPIFHPAEGKQEVLNSLKSTSVKQKDVFIASLPFLFVLLVSNVKSKKGKKSAEESESDDSDMDDLDDEEVSLGSMDEEFGEELEEEGGTFMDPDGGADFHEGKRQNTQIIWKYIITFLFFSILLKTNSALKLHQYNSYT